MHLTRRVALGATVCAMAAAAGCSDSRTKASADSAAAAGPTDTARGARGGASGGGSAGYARVATISGGLKTPEAVRYDPDQDVYFVTNINGEAGQKDNNGFISRVRPDGTIDSLRFIAGGRNGVTLNAPKGMAIVGDTLVVADIDAVRMFNKRTGAPIATVDLAGRRARFLNDVVVGPDGAVYVTDTGIQFGPSGMSHPGPDQIFKISGRTATVAVADSSLASPNGIAYDRQNGRFIIGSFGKNALLSWKPGDAKATELASGPGQFDGVEVLGDGRILASSWVDSTVAVYQQGGTATKVVTGVASPADIGIDTKRNRLLVPIFTGDRVEVFDIK